MGSTLQPQRWGRIQSLKHFRNVQVQCWCATSVVKHFHETGVGEFSQNFKKYLCHIWPKLSLWLNIIKICPDYNWQTFVPLIIFWLKLSQVPGPALHDPLGDQTAALSHLWKDFCQEKFPCEARWFLWWLETRGRNLEDNYPFTSVCWYWNKWLMPIIL